MAECIKRFAIVGFLSESEAQDAMQAALAHFKKGHTPSEELSRCDGNIVYLHSSDPREKTRIENFLLNQKGAQPRDCRCKA